MTASIALIDSSSFTLSQCGTVLGHDSFSGAPVTQLSRVARASVVFDLLPDFVRLRATEVAQELGDDRVAFLLKEIE